MTVILEEEEKVKKTKSMKMQSVFMRIKGKIGDGSKCEMGYQLFFCYEIQILPEYSNSGNIEAGNSYESE